jgi:hypothetical protein
MRLLACVSHHGLGHLAQTAPVLNALLARRPDIRLLVRSALPRAALAGRLRVPFEHLPEAVDCGFLMHDAIRVDLAASQAAYAAFHADWPARVAGEADRLRALAVDRVFSNVAYLPLAGAARAGLPAVALCSLNWLDIHRHYLGDLPGAEVVAGQVRDAYRSARAFLRPDPAMPMTALDNTLSIPPIALLGQRRGAAIRRRLGVPDGSRLVLLGMGGIDYHLDAGALAGEGELVWLVPDGWATVPGRSYNFARAGVAFIDLVASADALVTKPGYGGFVEAAAHGVPVLYLPREDWPETPWLAAWIEAHGRALCIGEDALRGGGAPAALAALWALPARPLVRADGAEVAVRRLLELFC